MQGFGKQKNQHKTGKEECFKNHYPKKNFHVSWVKQVYNANILLAGDSL